MEESKNIEQITKAMMAENVNDMTEKKNGFTYLSWASAWGKVLNHDPCATYQIVKDDNGRLFHGDSDNGYLVLTDMTIAGITRTMWLPVMDYKNKSMMNPTTFDVNKALMRCLTKNISMFGLGLYIYQGEDLPNAETDIDRELPNRPTQAKNNAPLTRQDMIDLFKALPADKSRAYMDKYKKDYGKSEDVDPRFLKNEFLKVVASKEGWR